MSDHRPASGVRYALTRSRIAPDHLVYEGFAHLPASDVPLTVRVEVPSGAVLATATPTEDVPADRAADLAKQVTPLVRAATKSEIAQGETPPRKIVRWRADRAS